MLFLAFPVFVHSVSFGAVNIFNFSIDDITDTISFDIQGTIDAGATIGTIDSHQLYIGSPGDNDWITGGANSMTISNNAGAIRDLHTGWGQYMPYAFGDHVIVAAGAFESFAIGDVIDASVSITGGTVVGANVDVNSIIVTAGYNSANPFPDVGTQIGSVVPEPKHAAMLSGVLVLSFVVLRRRAARG